MGRAVLEAVFTCQACGKTWGNHRTAQGQARQHAHRLRHMVLGEVSASVAYGAKWQTSGSEIRHPAITLHARKGARDVGRE